MYKSSLLFAFFGSLVAFHAAAQFPIQTQYLSINNVRAAVSANGDLFEDTSAGNTVPAYEFPKGSGKMANSFAGLWVCAIDSTYMDHRGAATFRSYSPPDYKPGPLDDSGHISNTLSFDWNKVWVITDTAIKMHRANQIHTLQNTAQDIITWPAFGNVHAQGYLGAQLTVNRALAPFVDFNEDGIYNFADGDYPRIKGDQALWCIYNDDLQHHFNETMPVGLQISLMAYAYTSSDLYNDAIFLDYELVQRKKAKYHFTTITLLSEADLGDPENVYIGSDSCRRMGIAYKPTGYDAVYQNALTMQGIALTKSPGDSTGYLEPLGTVSTYFNTNNSFGAPGVFTAFLNYSLGKFGHGAPITRSCNLHSNGPICPYVYPDDPSYSLGKSEVACGNSPDFRSIMLGTKPFVFHYNKPVHVSYCVFNTPLGSFNDNFNAIRARADTLLISTGLCNSAMFYPAALSSHSLPQISIVPNPARQFVSISSSSYPQPLQIFNAQGQLVYQQTLRAESTINLSHWPPSLYYVKLGASTRLMVVE
ncbi:MAG: hypothetical protein RL660_1739 [Bacteroidota bacterium]|jgi:hypothetical protein